MTLLFKKKYIEKIQRGEKTSTRRAKRPMVKPDGVYRLRVDFYSYMLDRIRVIRLYEQRRGSMTQEDMAKEGFTNLNEFQRRWAEHYQFLVDEQAVWVEELEYLGPDRNL